MLKRLIQSVVLLTLFSNRISAQSLGSLKKRRAKIMKEVMAVIRRNMINQTKQALLLAGIDSMTARTVKGRGKKR